MKPEVDKKRVKEISDVYRSIGIQSREIRKYFSGLANYPEYIEKKKKAIFIEADTTSCGSGEITDARLEFDFE